MKQNRDKTRSCFLFLSQMIFAANLLLATNAMAELEEDALLLQLSGDEQLISIATGTPRPVSKAPAVASVITADDIRASGAKTVLEALEQVPGLHIGLSTLRRISPVFSIRGIHTANSPQTLILFNGHEIPDTFNGSIASNLYLPVENIARIEIIRGPGSAVYGADAFAGVINIITKTDADINGLQSGVQAGSFNTWNLWGQYGGVYSGWHIAASVEYGHTNGDRNRIIERDFQTILDNKFETNASLAPGPLDTRYEALVSGLTISKDHWQLQFNSWNQEDTGVGPGTVNALDPTGYIENDQYLVNINYKNDSWNPDWSFNVNTSYLYVNFKTNYVLFPANTMLPISSDGNLDFSNSTNTEIVKFSDGVIGKPSGIAERTQFDLTSIYTGIRSHRWRLNAGMKYVEIRTKESKNFGPGVISDDTARPIDGTLTDVTGTSYIFHPGANRTVIYASIQDEWSFARDWSLTSGIRFDDYSDVGSSVNPRLSLVWNTRYDLTSKLLYGRAFRAPTFGELETINNPVISGNPNLKPEIINTLELAFDYKPFDKLNILFNLFYYSINGLIDFVDDGAPGGTATAQNSIDQKARGFELEAHWQVSRPLRLFGSVAVQNAEDANTGEPVADAPRKQLHMGGNWSINHQWFGQLDAFRIMDRPRAVGDTRSEIDDYTWVNLTINGKAFYMGLDVQLAVRNLLNINAREPGPTAIPNDYPLEGRSIYFAISKTF